MNLTIDNKIGFDWIPREQCFSWCQSQHIAYVYHNEWLIVVVMVLLIILCISRLRIYYVHKKEFESALLLTTMLIIVAYIVLFLMKLSTLKIAG